MWPVKYKTFISLHGSTADLCLRFTPIQKADFLMMLLMFFMISLSNFTFNF